MSRGPKKTTVIPQQDVRIGDWADHVRGDLDPRPVSAVSHTRGEVMVVGPAGTGVGPFPMANYIFTRLEEPTIPDPAAR